MRVAFLLLCLCEIYLGALDTGYPDGLMANCPGMNKSTIISEKTKRTLSLVIAYPSDNVFGYSETRCKLSAKGAACAAKYFDFKKRKTQIIVSGYMDTTFSPLARSIITMYINLGRNVAMLDTFPILLRPYPIAARVTKPLGELLGEFLAALNLHGLSHKHLEIVGGSLGAHIGYYASVKYYELTSRKPARLTGLDPAGPCYRNMNPKDRFNAEGAVKVDALHTNIDGFGIADSIAQIDFYANGGEFQPALAGDFIMPCFQLCSHVRAAMYWILAYTNPDKFLAVRCDSVADVRHGDCYDGNITSNVLGPRTEFNEPGIYYLPTKEVSPYYLGNEGLKKSMYGVNAYLLKPAPDIDMII
ncbi:lipase member H-B [Bombyx mori]|uniref:Lipase domain-containing protein n=1 Tax=Bombyx mori TaxID=7091 RepID=A0A8R2G8B1_BOMMO|nr:lipase member H-B [Bombyx mori]